MSVLSRSRIPWRREPDDQRAVLSEAARRRALLRFRTRRCSGHHRRNHIRRAARRVRTCHSKRGGKSPKRPSLCVLEVRVLLARQELDASEDQRLPPQHAPVCTSRAVPEAGEHERDRLTATLIATGRGSALGRRQASGPSAPSSVLRQRSTAVVVLDTLLWGNTKARHVNRTYEAPAAEPALLRPDRPKNAVGAHRQRLRRVHAAGPIVVFLEVSQGVLLRHIQRGELRRVAFQE